MEPLRQIRGRHLWTVGLATFLFSTSLFAAPAARVEFAVGGVTAETADGRVRTLLKGANVEEGETVNTNEGRAQLRFTDDGFVSLHSETVFRIDAYHWSGKTDGTELGFFRLLKGGLRTITGKLAKINKKAYQMSATVATIGIRGTEYTMQSNGDLVGSVTGGEIEVCNAGGCLAVAAGQSYYVADIKTKPIFSNKQITLGPSQPVAERARLRGTANATTLPVSSLGLRVDEPARANTTTSGSLDTVNVTTDNLFGTVDTTTIGLTGLTQGVADSLFAGNALNQPVQNLTGAIGGTVTGTTSTLGATTGGLLGTATTTTAGVGNLATGVTNTLGSTTGGLLVAPGTATGGVITTVNGVTTPLINGIAGTTTTGGLLGTLKLGY